MNIRQAERGDIPEIVAFSTGTFTWGDYVPDVIGEWIDDQAGTTLVAVVDGHVVGVARTLFLTPTEAWAHGVRIHPDHRGAGIAGMLADAMIDWAQTSGAKVVRLLIEDDNEASIRHVEKVGFRRSVQFMRASLAVGEPKTHSSGNGARRRPSSLAARQANVYDAPLAMASWASSEIGRSSRGLVGIGWRFHKLTLEDLESAGRAAHLFEVGSGWAMTATVAPQFHVAMLETRQEDAYESFRALIDAAKERDAEELTVWIPDIDWLIQTARRAGCDTSPMSVWEMTP